MVEEKLSIVKRIVRKKRTRFVMRGEVLLREVMEGRMERKRSRGKERMEMLEELYRMNRIVL